MTPQEMMVMFLTMEVQFQVLHWQTSSYARHKAYGEIYDSIQESADEFIEIFQGKYGRVFIEGEEVGAIQVRNISDESLGGFIDENILKMEGDMGGLLKENDTDLLNVRDEVVGSMNKLKYLLSLK